jgi:hypothetical protein
MSIRRINSTGRERIVRTDARVFVRTDPDGILTFDATIDLADYGLPADAQVFLEAYRQTTLMRFPCGTVASPQPPRGISRRLTDFASRDGLLFRVKVTSTGQRAGILLAEADRIPISDDEEQLEKHIALLPIAPGDLEQETWRVDLSGEQGPLLLVNMSIGDWKAVAASPIFRSLVYPAAMRQVLWHIYKIDGTQQMDDQDDWRCRWLQFAAALPSVGDPPLGSDDDSEWDKWICDAVESFARKHKMLDRYMDSLAVEASS